MLQTLQLLVRIYDLLTANLDKDSDINRYSDNKKNNYNLNMVGIFDI